MNRYKFTILQFGSLACSFGLFFILNYFFREDYRQDVQTYLSEITANSANQSIFGEVTTASTIVSMANSSLLILFILPMFAAIGVLSFSVFVLGKRINILNKELKEIREKPNV